MDDQLAATLLEYCRRTLPDRAGSRVSNLVRIADGWECDVYALGLEGGDQARDNLILRIYQGGQAGEKAGAEFRAMEKLRQAGYPVPRVYALAVEDSPLGKPFVLMEKIEGKVLGDVIRQPSGAEDPAWLRQFSHLLVELHRIDWRPFVADSARQEAKGQLGPWIEWARTLLGQLAATEYDAPLEWLDARARSIAPGRLAVVHQDFHPWNILLRDDGAAFVIDWTQADVLDPRLDLAWTLLLVSNSLGLTARDQVLVAYQELTGAPVRDLEIFEAAAAIKRMASITISLRGGAEQLGMRPGAEVQMAQNTSHLRTAYALFQERTGLQIPTVERYL